MECRVSKVRFAGKGRVELIDEMMQDELQAGEVLVRVGACGICGSDLLQYTGRWKQPAFTPGHELVGVVSEVGPGVKSPAAGDRVTAAPMLGCGTCTRCREGSPGLCPDSEFLTTRRDGAMADYVILPDYTIHRIPGNLSLEEAVIIEPLSVAVHSFRRFADLHGLDVGIVGAGAVGLLCVHAAKAMGAARVTCIAKYPFQKAIAEAVGADTVVEGTSVPQDLSGLADVAVDCVGGRGEALRQAMRLVRNKASIIAVGGYHGLAGLDMGTVVRDEITLLGSFCYSEIDGRHDMDIAIDMADASRKQLKPLVTHTFALTEAGKAFETALDKKKNGACKVVLVTGEDI